jgi:hypothetical protein
MTYPASTEAVARLFGMPGHTFRRHVRLKHVPAPAARAAGGQSGYVWHEQDVERARAALAAWAATPGRRFLGNLAHATL